MPFDIGWTEIAIIAVVAIIFIGPRDLPRVLKTMGEWVAQFRKLSREFRRHVDDMIRETELDEVKRQIQSVGDHDVGNYVRNTIDPKGELAEAFDFGGEEFKGLKSDGSPETTIEEKPAEPADDKSAEPAAGSEVAAGSESDSSNARPETDRTRGADAAGSDGPKDRTRGAE